MKRLISLSLAVLITLCMIVASERRAWGYVDPGSGLIALQTIASVVAAWAYMVRRRIRAFFTRKEAARRPAGRAQGRRHPRSCMTSAPPAHLPGSRGLAHI